jgi:hypothetical protein
LEPQAPSVWFGLVCLSNQQGFLEPQEQQVESMDETDGREWNPAAAAGDLI